jgi:tetraacyldisaccharide 4'-kinase
VATRKRQQIEQNKAQRRHERRIKPVLIVVGNLVAGGAGKTPLTISLANWLAQQSGAARVGMLCRGVGPAGGKVTAQMVDANSDVTRVGDEALLLAGVTGLPVAVGADRGQALATLLDHHPDLSVVLSDDGLQHAGLPRDIELAVFDQRAAGNGCLLPAGPLREPLAHLAGMDAIVENTGFAQQAAADSKLPPQAHNHHNRHRASSRVRDILPIAQWQQHMRQGNLATGEGIDVTTFARSHVGQTTAALAAIASPASFFAVLSANGIAHHAYPLSDHGAIESSLNRLTEPLVIVTEKDAVKCPPDPRIHVLRITSTPSPDLLNWLETTIHGLQTD